MGNCVDNCVLQKLSKIVQNTENKTQGNSIGKQVIKGMTKFIKYRLWYVWTKDNKTIQELNELCKSIYCHK